VMEVDAGIGLGMHWVGNALGWGYMDWDCKGLELHWVEIHGAGIAWFGVCMILAALGR